MSFKELFTREKNVVLYRQSARFRIVKYAILIPISAAIYWWWGGEEKTGPMPQIFS